MCILEKKAITLDELMTDLVNREAKSVRNMNRIKKLYHNDETFNRLMNAIIEKDVKRFTKLISKHKNIPSPCKTFGIILEIVECDGEEIEPYDTLTKVYPSRTLLYHGWTFSWIQGENTLLSIYNSENELVYQI